MHLSELQAELDGTLPGAEEEDEINEDLNITYNAGKHQVVNTPGELAGLNAAKSL